MLGFVGWMRIFEMASEFVEAHVRPGLAGVGRLVDAVARLDVAADARLAHPDVDDVGLDSDTATAPTDALRDLAIGDRRPCLAAVGRLPEAAARRAEVRRLRPALHAGDGDRAAAAIRPDAAPAKCFPDRGVDWRNEAPERAILSAATQPKRSGDRTGSH